MWCPHPVTEEGAEEGYFSGFSPAAGCCNPLPAAAKGLPTHGGEVLRDDGTEREREGDHELLRGAVVPCVCWHQERDRD